MISVELQMHYSQRAKRSAAAFFLQGDRTAIWLDTLSDISCDLEQVRLLPIPESRRDLTPQGVLVVTDVDNLNLPFPAPRYGWVGKSLLVPVEGAFSLALTDHEWETLLETSQRISVWHPQLGLIGFEPEEVLNAADLVDVRPPTQADWNVAEPGTGFPSRLISIQAIWPEDPQQMLQQGQDGIGSKGGELGKLPGKGLLGKAFGFAKGGAEIAGAVGGVALSPLAIAAKMLAGMMPQSAKMPGRTSGMENWANKVLQAGAGLFNARLREIDRLMKMLDQSPDEGLKYAIPMGKGNGLSGGVPGSRLMSRLVDFNLGNLLGGGGGPADYWNLPYDVQNRLVEKYRKAAEREVHLGRYRRAAYIYAELLGDLQSAASVLMAGKHYREAAVIFKEKLHRPLEAAECLKKGGLLHEAIELYKESGMYEVVGDLFVQLEERDEALAAYEQAVAKHLDREQRLEAARILNQKIASVDRALAVLDEGWRGNSYVRECLEESARLRGELGRHDENIAVFAELAESRYQRGRSVALVGGLTTIARSSPDTTTRHKAADVARVITAATVRKEPKSAPGLLSFIEKLAEEDRLLKRDTTRFLNQNPLRDTRKKVAVRSREKWRAECIYEHSLQYPGVTWGPFEMSGRHMIGMAKGPALRPTIMVGTWTDDGQLSATTAGWQGNLAAREVVVGKFVKRHFGVHRPVRQTLSTSVAVREEVRRLSPDVQSPVKLVYLWDWQWEFGWDSISIPEEVSEAGFVTPPFLTEETIAIACDSNILWAIEWPSLALKGFNLEGVPLTNHQLVSPPGWDFDPRVGMPMLAKDNAIYVGMGASLIQLTESGRTLSMEFDHPIHRLTGSVSHTMSRVGVFFEQGGVVCWPRLMHDEIFEPLPKDLVQPEGIFLRDGNLLLHSDGEWQLWGTQSRTLNSLGMISGVQHRPVSLLRHPHLGADHFIVCTADGDIAVYRFSK